VTLSWITAVIAVFIAGLCVIVLVMGIRYLCGLKSSKQINLHDALENNIDVTVYEYDHDVNGLDDIKGKHIGLYRDTGVVTGLEDEYPVCQESFVQTKDNEHEFSQILHSAAEVKRVTDKTILYFFKKIRPLKIKSGSIRIIYNCICQRLDDNKPVVLRMTKSDEGEYFHE